MNEMQTAGTYTATMLDAVCAFCGAGIEPTSDHTKAPMWLHRRGMWACRECFSRRAPEAPLWEEEDVMEEQSRMNLVIAEAARRPASDVSYLDVRMRPKQPVADGIREAVELYKVRHSAVPNACLLHPSDMAALGVGVGTIVWGVAVRMSFYVHEGVVRVGDEG